jgi:beta-ribofuranosylaminobenzene 5'-phosphate synthase
MSLIDLNGSLGRIDGGLGFAIDNPAFLIEFSDNCDFGLHYAGLVRYSIQVKEIYEKIKLTYQIQIPKLKIDVIDNIPEHQGLGSKTQFLMTIAKGITMFAKLDLSIEELATLIGRGGTSGIGIRTFAQGGFVLDGGHSYGSGLEKEQFLPSSASLAPPAPQLIHYDIPREWRILLIALNVQQGANNVDEINIFQKYCPIDQEDVMNISHRILMQLLPGIVTKRLDLVGIAQKYINAHGFKKIEISLQHPYVKELINWLEKKSSYPIGMSSFGPTIFLIVPDENEAIKFQKMIEKKIADDPNSPNGTITIVIPNNSGAEIIMMD